MSKKIAVLTSPSFDDWSRLHNILSEKVSLQDTVYIEAKENKVNDLIEEVCQLLKRKSISCPRATAIVDEVIIIYDIDYEIHKNRKNIASNKQEVMGAFSNNEVLSPKR